MHEIFFFRLIYKSNGSSVTCTYGDGFEIERAINASLWYTTHLVLAFLLLLHLLPIQIPNILLLLKEGIKVEMRINLLKWPNGI